MDMRSRLQGCSGQAADAVSAYTQVKMEDASTSLKNPKSEAQMAKIMVLVPLERNLCGHPLA